MRWELLTILGVSLGVWLATGNAAAVASEGEAAGKATRATSKAQAAKAPRFYFNVAEVRAETPADGEILTLARELLTKDLEGRPEFTNDVGGVPGVELPAELARRKLLGWNVTMKLLSLTHEVKPPRTGRSLKQMAVGAKVSVFGTTIGEEKLAFGGDGEAILEAEVVERRLAEEQKELDRDALAQAIKQAVDQAVGKLGQRQAQPLNESRRRRGKK